MKKVKKIMSVLLSLGMLATQLTFVQAADTEDMYDKTVIYEEDFNNVSDSTLAGWKSNFPGLTATKGQWYSGWGGVTNTLKLVEHTGADDKCIAQEHVSGKDDNVFFVLPGSVTDDGIKKYEISFDYCAAGNNAESFYLRTASGTEVKATNAVNMSYAQGWQNVTMILDVEKKAWSIGSYNVPNTFNVSNVFDGSDLGVRFQILASAAADKVIKFDNFKVTKYTLKPDKYVIADSAVSFISVDDVVQTNLNAVSRKLSKITVDFDEAIDETTITDETVFVDGKADYTTTYADNKLTITINSEYLKALTNYKLTIDGLKTVSGKDVSSKEISFKTVEKISVRSLLYSEDFNNVSDSTLAGWKSNFPGLTATKGQWYSGWSGTTNTLKLVEHTSADDKCIAQEHSSGKDDNVFFILPGSVANDGINKYEISFDYCAAGGGAESFYLRTASGTAVKATEAVNMSYTQGWQNVTMILDVEKKSWSIGSYNVPNTFNVSNVFDGSDLGVRFQILTSAAAGKVIKFDNFKVYGIKESSTIDIANGDVTITNKDGFVQSNLNKVDSNLDSITIDVSEELDETTVTKENVVLDCEGGADYDVAYSNSQIIITADAGLKLGTDYKLSINGLKSATGKAVEDYELEFTTSEVALKTVEIYSENFNDVSAETVSGWNTAYAGTTAEKGKWYSSASTTPANVENTSADDKCFSTSAHTNGTEDRIYFKLPGDATNGSIKKYEITFDYYAYGNWCDWFHLYNSDGDISSINMDFTKGWRAVSMTLDLEDPAWIIDKATCTENISNTINNKDLTFCIRLHGDAAAGSTIKVDNFKVSMVVEAKNLSEETLTVKACTFTDGTNAITQIPANGTVTADVDLTINQPGEYEFTAFIAAYDNDGTLQNVKVVPVATTFNDSEIEVEGLSVAVDGNTSLCQVFIWNMENNSLMPLTNVIPLKK